MPFWPSNRRADEECRTSYKSWPDLHPIGRIPRQAYARSRVKRVLPVVPDIELSPFGYGPTAIAAKTG
jgi:hypothetical protein